MFNFLQNIGPTELIILLVILIFFFGTRIITNLARTSGQTIKEAKNLKKEFIKSLEPEQKNG